MTCLSLISFTFTPNIMRITWGGYLTSRVKCSSLNMSYFTTEEELKIESIGVFIFQYFKLALSKDPMCIFLVGLEVCLIATENQVVLVGWAVWWSFVVQNSLELGANDIFFSVAPFSLCYFSFYD